MYVLYLLCCLSSTKFGALGEIRTHTVSDLNAVRLPDCATRAYVSIKKFMVPPPGIEPGSMDFQSTAMTTFAKAA